MPAIQLSNLRFSYSANVKPVIDVDELTIAAHERVFLYGPSGSGKTTLLGLIGGILVPQQGTVSILGQQLTGMTASQRDSFRGQHIGYIFQMFNLIPYLSVGDNILLPYVIRKGVRTGGQSQVQTYAQEIAGRLGIRAKFADRVTDLSVGQQQRVAAARALVGRPEIIIADEPTSALDADHRESFLRLLFEACAVSKTSIVFVSHDHALAQLFDRSLSLATINRAGAPE